MDKGISINSIFSENPQIYSDYTSSNSNTQGLVLDVNSTCKLYVDGWNTYQDRIPTGFIDDQNVVDLLTPAPLSVVSINNPYIRFLIQSIQPNFQEIVTPMVNLSQGYSTYVFGAEPATVQISGILAHTVKDNWSELFLSLYHYFLRASRLAELSVLNNKSYQVVLQYQGKIMKGSILSFAKATSANNEQSVSFNMNFLLKELRFAWKTPAGSSNTINYTTTTFKVGDKFNVNRITSVSPASGGQNIVADNPATSGRP